MMEKKHALRQYTMQFSRHSRRITLISEPWSWKIPLAWLAGTALWLERRTQYSELLELDDRLLADIGLSRTDVENVRRSRLYPVAWRDRR
jgi:uncharacterized protein YjiS (DUF1127 family)